MTHRLSVALPFAMDPVNAWLVDSGDGWVLIDTAMPTPACWRMLDRALRETGVAWNDVRTLLITHMHPDHVGLVPQAAEASGARVAMHRADTELLRDFAIPDVAEHWNGVAMSLAGTPDELVPKVNAAFRMLTVKFPEVAVDTLLKGGERFGGLQAIWSPGHSPGHVCFYDAKRKILFSGDHILDTASPNIGWLPEGNPLGDYLASLKQMRELEVEMVMPGHGEPFGDHRGWIDRALAHHLARCEKIVDLLQAQPRSAHDLTRALWERPLDPIHYRFAIFEILAHLVHLETLGRATRDGVIWSS